MHAQLCMLHTIKENLWGKKKEREFMGHKQMYPVRQLVYDFSDLTEVTETSMSHLLCRMSDPI